MIDMIAFGIVTVLFLLFLIASDRGRKTAVFLYLIIITIWVTSAIITSQRRYTAAYNALAALIESVAETGQAPDGYCAHLMQMETVTFSENFEITSNEFEFGEQYFWVQFANQDQYYFRIYPDETCWFILGRPYN